MNNTHELKVYMDKDIDMNKILDKKVAIIGYGSQGYDSHSLITVLLGRLTLGSTLPSSISALTVLFLIPQSKSALLV